MGLGFRGRNVCPSFGSTDRRKTIGVVRISDGRSAFVHRRLYWYRIATAANTRTANAAREGAAKALPLAFKGGAVMGFTVAGLALLGISFNYLLWVTWLSVDSAFQVVAAFGLGASSIALFARIGGGIYTKAADVGGDLVGKVEAGIPCLLYTSPSPRDGLLSRMPSSA